MVLFDAFYICMSMYTDRCMYVDRCIYACIYTYLLRVADMGMKDSCSYDV